MLSLLLLFVLFAAYKCDIPPRWGKYGPYSCTVKSVYIGGYVSGGPQYAYLLYPTAAIENKTTLPFVAFAHGMTLGGNATYTGYVNVLNEVCSYGYIIAAPQSCPHIYCQTFYQDVITTITTMAAKTVSIDPALEYADFSRNSVYGHSMGGAQTVHVSDYKDDINLTCSAAMHPSLAQETNQSTSIDVAITMLWITGNEDTAVTPSEVYNGFIQDKILPKIYVDITDATHVNMIDEEAPYIAQWFDCNIKNDDNACSYFYPDKNGRNGPNNICTGGYPMTDCYICTPQNKTGCFE